MMNDLQELYLAAYELGLLKLDEKERLWPHIVYHATKLEKECGESFVGALAMTINQYIADPELARDMQKAA